MMKFFFLLAFYTVTTWATVIEAPFLGYNFQQNPSSISWKHITTKHFEIIFPEEVETEAKRVAVILERAYPFVSRSLQVEPARIPIILQNQSVDSNGFVTLAPRRSEWYLTPSIDPEISNTEWLKTLAIHEFRHVVQFQKTRRGFNLGYEILLGEIGQALGLALTLPPWFLEGDAVGIETAFTKGGRGRLPMFDRDLRTLLLSGKKWNYDKAHLGSYEDYIPNHYVYGYFYTSWLRNKYGDLFLSKIANNSAETSYNPLSYYNAHERLTGETFESFYKDVMKDLIDEWRKREVLDPTPIEIENKAGRFGWTNYYYPQKTEEGKTIALKKGLSFIDQFVLIDGKKEELLLYPGVLQSEYPYKVRGNKLVFFEWELDPRWGYRDYSRLKVFDLKEKKFVIDKRETKGRLAIPDHKGEKILYVEWTEKQGQFLVVLDKDGKEGKRIQIPKEEVITGLDWLNSQEAVLVIHTHDDMKSLVKIHLESESREVLIPPRETNIGFVAVEKEMIFFESPESGIDNIWLWTKEGVKQLTNSRFGAYSPSLDENKLLYSDYTVDGMNVVTKTLPLLEEQKSEGSFYPIYEKFSKDEKFQEFENATFDQESLVSKNYSQTKNALNLHSWMIIVPPLSNTVTLAAYSRDVLNKFTVTAGTEYNVDQRTIQGFAALAWTHYYPVFDFRAGYGNRRQTIETRTEKFEDTWEEGTAEGGISVPWKYIQGRFIHAFTARAFGKIIKVTGKQPTNASEISQGALFSPGAGFSYSVTQRLARRDMNPHLGFQLRGNSEEGRDITGDDQKGSIQSLDSRLYLPGLWYHHSFFHQLAFEKQRNDSYEYASYIFYPRGTQSVFLQEFVKYSGNYLLPLFYPDYNISRYIYFKRIALNLFYDELNGRNGSFSYRAASTGWETIFEFSVARLMLPISLGVRGSYVLSGREEPYNYEIFLAPILGSF